jgi:glycosyltransferase involved in cell wall biosynthesis
MTTGEDRPLRVAIDARIPGGEWGGVQQVVQGLTSGFSKLDGDDEYLILGFEDAGGWLGPYVGGGCRLVQVPRTMGKSRRRRAFDWIADRSIGLSMVASRVAPLLGWAAIPIPASDGFAESLGVDLLHFVTPQGFRTDLPTIYQPHDLLHVHLPETLAPLRRAYRERAYREFSQRATFVAAMTDWGRVDLCRELELDPGRVAVVPWAPVAGLEPMARTEQAAPRPGLPERFLLYPAQTWPHKNHVRLLEAIALLRAEGVKVDLVCTGRLNGHFAVIKKRVADLALDDQVQFLGYVTTEELSALYARATALVFPSRFEGWGLPVVEAFAFGLPVAASNATVLPEVTAGAALLFDPLNTRDMADAIARVWSDEALRTSLRNRGRVRASGLSWDRTAETFRALYRLVAGHELTEADRALLAPPTLIS